MPAPDGPAPDGIGRVLVLVGIVVLVALAGVVAWVAGGHDDVLQTFERADQRFPTTAVTTTVGSPPVTSAPAAVTSPPTTPAPSTVPPSTSTVPSSTTTSPASSTPSSATPSTATPSSATPSTVRSTSIGELVPDVVAFAERPATPAAVQVEIDKLLADRRHDVASDGDVSALCAIVALDGPVALEGRWERDGRRVASTSLADRDAPGYGDCVGDTGELLDAGSYQYIATGVDGDESAAGGFVVGAPPIRQRFVNNGDEPICVIRIAPSTSRYFEAYVSSPIAPKSEVTLVVAAVAQDVETVACGDGGGDALASFEFDPTPERVQPLDP